MYWASSLSTACIARVFQLRVGGWTPYTLLRRSYWRGMISTGSRGGWKYYSSAAAWRVGLGVKSGHAYHIGGLVRSGQNCAHSRAADAVPPNGMLDAVGIAVMSGVLRVGVREAFHVAV